MTTAKRTPRYSRELTLFFVLAFALSWSIGVPLALAQHGIIPSWLPPWAHYLAAYGPMLSAVVVTGLSSGAPGLKELGRRMTRWRNCPKWWIVSLSPLLVGYVAILVLNAVMQAEISLTTLGAVNYLPPLGLGALVLWFLTFGLGEETGWRGFALPRLQKGRSALAGTALLAGLWARWHLPQFFYLFEPAMAIPWLIGLFAGAIFLTWLYNSAKSSVLMVAIWHGSFNFMTASAADIGALPAVVSTVVILLAFLIVIRTDTQSLVSI